MDSIKELIKNIVICYVIINIIDALLISKKYEKYIKVFTGIIIMLVIINAGEKICVQIFNNDYFKSTNIYQDIANECIKNTESKMDDAAQKIHKEYEKSIVKSMYDEYEVKINKIDIYEDGERGIERIVVRVKDRINKALLTDNEKDKIENVVKDKILEYYNVGKECIKIRFV